MRFSHTVEAIHELPLHTDTKAFSALDIFKKLKCYEKTDMGQKVAELNVTFVAEILVAVGIAGFKRRLLACIGVALCVVVPFPNSP